MTAPVGGGGCMFPTLDMADASGLPPEPPQAIKKAVVATITREREKKSRGKNAVNFFIMRRLHRNKKLFLFDFSHVTNVWQKPLDNCLY
jgi:hypothetical protein